jgi:hypothetical protein
MDKAPGPPWPPALSLIITKEVIVRPNITKTTIYLRGFYFKLS